MGGKESDFPVKARGEAPGLAGLCQFSFFSSSGVMWVETSYWETAKSLG